MFHLLFSSYALALRRQGRLCRLTTCLRPQACWVYVHQCIESIRLQQRIIIQSMHGTAQLMRLRQSFGPAGGEAELGPTDLSWKPGTWMWNSKEKPNLEYNRTANANQGVMLRGRHMDLLHVVYLTCWSRHQLPHVWGPKSMQSKSSINPPRLVLPSISSRVVNVILSYLTIKGHTSSSTSISCLAG